LTETTSYPQQNLGGVVSNAFGEHYLFAINRNAFQSSDASTVFRSYFGDTLFKENTFYVVAGTDSGLLYQYIKVKGVPKGSRYLFIELPPVLEHLLEMQGPENEIVISTPQNWEETGIDNMDMLDYAVQGQLVLIRSLGVVHGHYADYQPFWQKLREDFDLILETYRSGINNRQFTLVQLENLTENQTSAICLKDSFKGKTAVLLAGGPSLDDLLPWVREHRKNLLVISVSRISHSLLKAGIQPDICVSVDPYPINLKVSREMLEFQDGTLLVNEFHLCSSLLSSWGGKKVYTGQRYPWSTPLEPENLPACLGSTVTNTALTIAVETGVTQLVLGGADFCFSQKGYTHATGSVEHTLGPRPMNGDKRVETNSGKMADTRPPFLNSARTIDQQAAEAHERGCRVINPAPDAMRLPHVEHITVEEIQLESLERPAREIIAARLPSVEKGAQTRFYHEALGELDRVLADLRTIKSKSVKALDYTRKILDKKEKISRFDYHDKVDSIEKQLAGKYTSTATFIKQFGLPRFVLLLRKDEESLENIAESDRLYFQAYVDTINELKDIMGRSRARILSRLEEEKPKPNIQQLIDQWRRDKQPGRAIQWAQHHADYVNQLPEAEQQALRDFQGTFEDSIIQLDREYQKSIEREAKLDGLNARAREYYRSRDEEGLQRLRSSLENHCDAELYTSLLDGYLAELHDDATTAIAAYQKVSAGPSHIDAQMRLFALHTSNHDFDSALETLKTLSGTSPVYTPMYADMLNATGNVERAVEIYTDFLLDNPEDLNSVMKLGMIYQQHGASGGVEWAMNYILSKDPGNQAAKAMLSSLDHTQAIDQ